MNRKTVFSDNQVIDFCGITADDNPIHNPSYMHAQNKSVVVPGMLLFSTIINLLHQKATESFNCYRLIFGNVICTNETIDLGFASTQDKAEHKYLYAINGHDMFSVKSERSIAFKNDSLTQLPINGIDRKLPYNRYQLNTFKRLTHSINDALSDFLFCIAYASAALFKAIREPLTEVEREIYRLLDKTINPDQVSPFYQNLEINQINNNILLSDKGEINYNINFTREKENRVYLAQVSCYSENQLLYQSIYRLIAIPDKIIMRMVKEHETSNYI